MCALRRSEKIQTSSQLLLLEFKILTQLEDYGCFLGLWVERGLRGFSLSAEQIVFAPQKHAGILILYLVIINSINKDLTFLSKYTQNSQHRCISLSLSSKKLHIFLIANRQPSLSMLSQNKLRYPLFPQIIQNTMIRLIESFGHPITIRNPLSQIFVHIIYMAKYQLQQFKRENIQEFICFVYDSYSAGTVANSTWKLLPKDEFNQQCKRIINAFITAAEIINQKRDTNIKFNTFIRIEGKMAIACFSCELYYFFNVLVEAKITPPVYEVIRQEMLRGMDEQKATVDVRHVVRKEFQGRGLYSEHLKLKAKEQLDNGYEYRVYTTNNVIVLKHGQKYGGELLSINFEYLGVATEAYLLRVKNEDLLPLQ